MKKRIICCGLVMLMMLVSGNALAVSQEPENSLQIMYAKLQLEMAEINKQQAMARMSQIAQIQEEQRQVSGYINAARQCQTEAQSTGEAIAMPADMAAYMNAKQLPYNASGADLQITSEGWGAVISVLTARMEELSTNAQREMIYVQDFMGQYNSYIENTNTQISNANQTLSSLARGQSMYGHSEAGLAVTGLLVGLVLGCAITLVVQKTSRKKENT